MKAALFLALLGLPDGPGKATTVKVCGACHSADVVILNRNTRKGWTELVDDMISKGARATPSQRREIIGYLAKYFPED